MSEQQDIESTLERCRVKWHRERIEGTADVYVYIEMVDEPGKWMLMPWVALRFNNEGRYKGLVWGFTCEGW